MEQGQREEERRGHRALRGSAPGCRVLGSCLWVSWKSITLTMLTGLQGAGPVGTLASLGDLGPVCGDLEGSLGLAHA